MSLFSLFYQVFRTFINFCESACFYVFYLMQLLYFYFGVYFTKTM